VADYAPNKWILFAWTFTSPAGAVFASAEVYAVFPGGAIAVGDTRDVTGALLEASPVLGDYFDGDTSPDPDLTPAWTGPVGASTSTLSGRLVARVSGGIASTRHPGLPLRIITTGRLLDWPDAAAVRASIDTEAGRKSLASPDLAPGYYGRALIEDVTREAPEDDGWFDGDTADTPAALHHWTGPRHASTSVKTLAWSPG
jgi:hypothetical protein